MNAHPHRFAASIPLGLIAKSMRDSRAVKPADLEAWLNRGAAPSARLTLMDAIACALVAFAVGAGLAVML